MVRIAISALAIVAASVGFSEPRACGQLVKTINPSDGSAGDYFGGYTQTGGTSSVSIFGDTIVVGAFAHDEHGAAYVYDRNQGGIGNWGEVARLSAHGADNIYGFGYGVGIDGDQIVVGAPFSDGTFVNGAIADALGRAYLFTRNQGGTNRWGNVTEFEASQASPGDMWGLDVSMHSDTVVVVSTTTRGATGAVSLFGQDETGGDGWMEVAKLTASDGRPDDYFGGSRIANDTLIVGAPLDDDDGQWSGAAYIYQRHENAPIDWNEMAKLTASDAQSGDWFGIGADIDGEMTIVGASQFGVSHVGVPAETGAAYIFRQNTDDTWEEVAKLVASDGKPGDAFGEAVAIYDDIAVVGAPKDPGHSGQAFEEGAAYVFARNAGGPDNWGEILKLTAPDGEENDHFGKGVDIYGGTIVVTAPGHSENLGAAYVFEVSPHMLLPGDANQDLSFDQIDLVQVLQAAKYLTGDLAEWGEGDWNGAPGGAVGEPPAGDGVFDQLDVIAALSGGHYMSGPYASTQTTGDSAAIAVVPEPSSVMLVLAALSFLPLSIRHCFRLPRHL